MCDICCLAKVKMFWCLCINIVFSLLCNGFDVAWCILVCGHILQCCLSGSLWLFCQMFSSFSLVNFWNVQGIYEDFEYVLSIGVITVLSWNLPQHPCLDLFFFFLYKFDLYKWWVHCLCSMIAPPFQKEQYFAGKFVSFVIFYPCYLDEWNLPSFIIEVNRHCNIQLFAW